MAKGDTCRGESVVQNGREIKRLRVLKGWSQKYLAGLAKISKSAFIQYESNKINVPIIKLTRIAKSLDVPAEQLICKEVKESGFVQHGTPDFYHTAVQGCWKAICRELENDQIDNEVDTANELTAIPEVHYDIHIDRADGHISGSCQCLTPPFDQMRLKFKGTADGTGKFSIDCNRDVNTTARVL